MLARRAAEFNRRWGSLSGVKREMDWSWSKENTDEERQGHQSHVAGGADVRFVGAAPTVLGAAVEPRAARHVADAARYAGLLQRLVGRWQKVVAYVDQFGSRHPAHRVGHPLDVLLHLQCRHLFLCYKSLHIQFQLLARSNLITLSHWIICSIPILPIASRFHRIN